MHQTEKAPNRKHTKEKTHQIGRTKYKNRYTKNTREKALHGARQKKSQIENTRGRRRTREKTHQRENARDTKRTRQETHHIAKQNTKKPIEKTIHKNQDIKNKIEKTRQKKQ